MTDIILRSSVAALLFVGVSTILATVLALVEGSVTPAVALASLSLAAAPAALGFRAARVERLERPSPWDAAALLLFGVVAVRHFGWLVFDLDGRVSTPDAFNYGDLPLHWTYIRFFAKGAAFWPQNPIFTGARLEYPFGMDLFTALLVRLGLPLAGTLCTVGLAGAALLLAALFRWGRGFAVAAFVLSGGVGSNVAWKNLFLALFVPQRGFLFALPAGLLLLWSWRERFFRNGQRLPGWVEGLLWGVMPLFHLHTFLLVSVIFGLWALVSGRALESWNSLALAFLPACWTTYEVTNGFRSASLVWWKPGGMIGDASVLPFLALNFTLFLPLFVWGFVVAARRGDREALAALGPGLGLFTALFFLMLAPWEWDNTKVMIWCYLLMLPAVERLVANPLPLAGRVLFLGALLGPATPALVSSLGTQHAYEIARADELTDVCGAVAGLPVGGRVATAQTFNHPVALCGQPLVAGYAGHLWSHGIRSKPVEESLASLMAGEAGWEERGRALKARYLFWGAREAAAFPASRRPWEVSRPLLWDGPSGRLYDLGD